MSLVLVGLNHKTAPIHIREGLSMDESSLREALTRLVRTEGIKEALILSTCNRIEVLVHGSSVHGSVDAIVEMLAHKNGSDPRSLDSSTYSFVDNDAVRHLFTVASSLDSMVVGEPQILGQVKDAYRISAECKATGPMLNRVLHHTFRVCKRVRSETGIGKHAVSVGYAAVELARSIFETFENKTVLLVGAGEMVELAAQHFVEKGVRRLLITNRTFSRAEELARQFHGEPIPFEAFTRRLVDTDIVLSCTGASEYVIDLGDVKLALKLRKNRPIFFIDIAVPRDVDPRVNQIENAYLYDIDDLQRVIQENQEHRKSEVEKARTIIEGEVSQFVAWFQSLEAEPTIKAIRQMAEEVRRGEIERTLSHLPGLGERERRSLEAMTNTIVNKILHRPITNLKREGGKNGAGIYVQVARELFGLDGEREEP